MEKAECVNLDKEKPHCFPYGYEQCKLTGKICLPYAYKNNLKACFGFKQKPQPLKERLEDITYVFLINSDVPMSGGKVGAQIANVAVQLPRANLKPLEDPRTYVYSAPEDYMLWLIQNHEKTLNLKYTVDSGHTEFTVGKLTCLGFKRESWMVIFTKSLNLWKQEN